MVKIESYTVTIKGSNILYEFCLGKKLPFLSVCQLDSFKIICIETHGNVVALEDYLNSLGLGTFRFLPISYEGICVTYYVVRVL